LVEKRESFEHFSNSNQQWKMFYSDMVRTIIEAKYYIYSQVNWFLICDIFLQVMKPFYVDLTLVFMSSCIPTISWLLWDPICNPTCGGKNIWHCFKSFNYLAF
jgi:hypothetical protein